MIHGYNAGKQNSSSSDYPWQNIEIPSIFFQQENCKFLLQKEIVLLTIRHHQSYWGKNPLFSLRFLLLYKKVKMVGLPKVTFGLPNLLLSQRFISQNFYKNITLIKVDRSSMRRILLGFQRIFSTLLLQQRGLQKRTALGIGC